jgi:hypothetical protein
MNHNSAVRLTRKVAESRKLSLATRDGIPAAIVVEVNCDGSKND